MEPIKPALDEPDDVSEVVQVVTGHARRCAEALPNSSRGHCAAPISSVTASGTVRYSPCLPSPGIGAVNSSGDSKRQW